MAPRRAPRMSPSPARLYTPASRSGRPPRVPPLRGDTDGRVGGAVAVVAAAPLQHLEEQAGPEQRRVEVQQLSFADGVVEDAELAHALDGLRRQLGASGEVLVVVVRDRRHGYAALAHRA